MYVDTNGAVKCKAVVDGVDMEPINYEVDEDKMKLSDEDIARMIKEAEEISGSGENENENEKGNIDEIVEEYSTLVTELKRKARRKHDKEARSKLTEEYIWIDDYGHDSTAEELKERMETIKSKYEYLSK